MATLYVTDQNTGDNIALKVINQGDGTYVLAVDTQGAADEVIIAKVTLLAKSGPVTVGPTGVLPAPAGGIRNVVSTMTLQNETAAAINMAAYFGATPSNGFRVIGQNQGDGIVVTFPAGREWRGGDAESLNITPSGVGYSLLYFTEAV